MRRHSFLTFLKEKSFLIVLVLMLVSAGTMAALFSIGSGDGDQSNEVAKQGEILPNAPSVKETEKTEEEATKTGPKTTIPKKTDTKERKLGESAKNEQNAVMEIELEGEYLTADQLSEAATEDVVAEEFSEEAALYLQKPVEGEVIMEFAMDHSIYFSTLAQYQYNPAMIISVPEGTEVFSCAAGTVTEVGKTNEYGHYVTMDLGNGYVITYGQLFDINTEVGESLDAGARIGMVAYPTRNYTMEGENLYLRLEKDGTPVDPQLYMNEKN